MEATLLDAVGAAIARWRGTIDADVADELDRLEGHRFLLRQVASSVEIYLESGTADHPQFYNTISTIRKTYADSPDTDYMRAHIQLKRGAVYRLAGRIPKSTVYFGVQLYRAKGLTGKNMADQEIPRKPNGDFELFITALDPSRLPGELKGKTVFHGHGDEIALIVRQYYTNRANEPPITLNLVRVDSQAPRTPPLGLSREFMAEGTRRVVSNVDRKEWPSLPAQATLRNTMQAFSMLSAAAHGQFIRGGSNNLFPTLDNRYMVLYLDDLTATASYDSTPVVLLRGKVPPARYFSVCLYNRWLESLDYVHRSVYYNHSHLKLAEDGTWEVVISNVFPGHTHWLDASGHSSIFVLTRELLPQAQEDPDFSVIRTTIRDLPNVSNRSFQQGAPAPRL